jgi:hypothetical protein
MQGYRTMSGESKSVTDAKAGASKMRVFPSFLNVFYPKDIFNADKCGLFFSLLPHKTYVFRDKIYHGGR